MTLDWSGAAVLSLTEFEVAWEAEGHDETPWELEPPRQGRTPDERRAVVAAAFDRLTTRGLAQAGSPHPRLRAAMDVLAHRDLSVDLRMRGRSLVSAVAARRDGAAVLAVRHRDEIALLDIPAGRLVQAAVDVLGPVDAGYGRVVEIPGADLDAAAAVAGNDVTLLADELVRRGTARADAGVLARMCRDVDRRGMFGAATGRRRAPYVVGVHRTPSGYFGQLRRQGSDGRDVISVGPLDGAGLSRRLDELTEAAADTPRW